MAHHLVAGNEAAFMAYEESIVYELQRLWKGKDEALMNCPVIDVSAGLEDIIYRETLKQFSLPTTANIWSKQEYIDQFCKNYETFKVAFINKDLPWKKVYDEGEKNPQNIYELIMKENKTKKKVTKKEKPPASTESNPDGTSDIPNNENSTAKKKTTKNTNKDGTTTKKKKPTTKKSTATSSTTDPNQQLEPFPPMSSTMNEMSTSMMDGNEEIDLFTFDHDEEMNVDNVDENQWN